MKILVIGGGGREHALVWKLSQSSRVKKIYAAPGNPGIAELADCLPIAVEDFSGLLAAVKENKIDLVVVGPEIPLVAGIADLFSKEKIPVFGPSREAAQLEGSKAFTKNLLREAKIPTAAFEVFQDFESASRYLKSQSYPLVIKADGLAAGKGVVICSNEKEAMVALKDSFEKKIFGNAGLRVVIEEFLSGVEASFHVLVDGNSILPLASSQDHKRALDQDQGKNTGGMGAYSPYPGITPELEKRVLDQLLVPTLKRLKKRGILYRGVLYAGLMLTKEGPKLLEYNVRFGDPETQVILPRLKNDLLDLIEAVLNNRLEEQKGEWEERVAVCVVMTARGYPGEIAKGDPIEGIERAKSVPGTILFQAGTRREGDRLLTNGGRVLGVTALGKDLRMAREQAYDACEKIYWKGVHYRKDIGLKGIG